MPPSTLYSKVYPLNGLGDAASTALRICLGASAAVAILVGAAEAQQVPPAPPAGINAQQVQQLIQARGMGSLVAQRIRDSGMTPDQIRARLQSAGYSPDLLDSYMGSSADTTQRPGNDILRGMSALGLAQTVPGDTLSPAYQADTTRNPRDTASRDSMAIDTTGARLPRGAAAPRLRLFGLDVFRRATTQFTPVTSGPVDPDYRLGPGDELVLILTGNVEQAHSLPVSREGFIVIPQVGQIFVANLTLEQLRNLLYTRLGRVYSDVRRGAGATTHFEVTISRVRVNQVFVNGEVMQPGAYAVSAVGTALNALYQAGGPTERGDFRRVRIMRRGLLVETLDLYDYLLGGNVHDDVRLEQGDVVFVPPRSHRVSVEGSVLRPAIYDLADGQGLKDLVQMAGGLLPDAYTGRAQVERVLPPGQRAPGGRDRTQIDVDLAMVIGEHPTVRLSLEPDDKVTIFGVSPPVRNRVTLRGDVWHPGTFQLEPGMTISSLIGAAGGLKPDVYLERAHILRLLPDSTRQVIPASLVGMRPRGAPGDSSLPSGEAGRPLADLPLQEFDEVTVYGLTSFRPERPVSIFGNVQRPGVVLFRDSMTLKDAVILAGGLRDDAYLLEAEIARIPDSREDPSQLAQVIRVPLDSSYVLEASGYLARPTGARGAEPRLQPYDNVFIRRVPGWELQRNVVVSGEVRFPGRYSLVRRDERVADVIRRAGGVTDVAYVKGAQFYRADSRAGRVGIDLERVLRDSTNRDNLILFAGDSLFVPQYQPVVRVDGAVNSPVAVAYQPGHNAGWYVDRAGGYARRADKSRTYTVQPNGAVDRRNSTVQPGARIYVPQVPADQQGTNWTSLLASLATILASALTLVLVVQRL